GEGQGGDQGAFRQVEAALLAGFPEAGGEQGGVSGVASPPGKGEVARPRVEGVFGPPEDEITRILGRIGGNQADDRDGGFTLHGGLFARSAGVPDAPAQVCSFYNPMNLLDLRIY